MNSKSLYIEHMLRASSGIIRSSRLTVVVAVVGLSTTMAIAQPSITFPDTTAIKWHVNVLAHDSLEGRGTGTRGGAKAADYLERRLSEWGLVGGAPDGSFRQPVPVHAATPIRADMKIVAGGDTARPRLWDDILPLSSGNHANLPVATPLIFVGYGITAPEFDYNDYRSIDVRGSVVVMLAGEPPSDDPEYFNGHRATIHSALNRKIEAALSRGARGTILIPTPRDESFRDWEHWRRELRMEDVRLAYGIPEQFHALLRADAAQVMFRRAPLTLEEILARDAAGGMRSLTLEPTLTFEATFRQRDAMAHNIAAIVPGSDPTLAASTVIVGAHYDHLGIGDPVEGDSIYNGLFDNALGSAVALEIARHLQEDSRRPRRSVLFLFFTGEEKGLLGSKVYISDPTRPLATTSAMINIDGVAGFERFRSVIPIGGGLSTLDASVSAVANRHGLAIDTVPGIFLEGDPLSSSDHWPFIEAGVPSLLPMEGLQYESTPYEERLQRFVEWGIRAYHQPQDDLRQPVSYEAVGQHAGVLFDLIRELADADAAPEWYPGSPYATARLRSQAGAKR